MEEELFPLGSYEDRDDFGSREAGTGQVRERFEQGEGDCLGPDQLCVVHGLEVYPDTAMCTEHTGLIGTDEEHKATKNGIRQHIGLPNKQHMDADKTKSCRAEQDMTG